jgi:DNA-binding response OmpR family regulator
MAALMDLGADDYLTRPFRLDVFLLGWARLPAADQMILYGV